MKAAELKELGKEELQAKLVAAEKDMAELKLKHSLNQLENPLMIRSLRRDIARMKTILS